MKANQYKSPLLRILAVCLMSVPGLTAYAATQSVSYHYNELGLVDVITGPRTDVPQTTQLGYDALANLSSLTNALGQSWQYSNYDALGLPGSITDPNGITTTLSYDGDGRLTGLSRAGQSWSYSYDALGQLTASTNPAGQTITRTYGDDHRLNQISYPDGTSFSLTYDAMGNVTAQKESGGSLTIETSYQYDELGRILSVINGAGTPVAAYSYDTNSNVTGTRNANPVSRTLQYDALNRLVTETDELGYNHNAQYNSRDALTQWQDGNNATTTYTRNGLDQITSRVSPDTGTTNYSYDDAGNLTGLTLADSTPISRSYDALNRLTQIALPDSSSTYRYDEGSQGIGHLTSAIAGNVTQEWQYNEAGQLLSQSQLQTVLQPKLAANQLFTDLISYTYDNQGQLSELHYPQGLVVHYNHNSAGQIDSISSELNSEQLTLVNSASYTTGGRLAELQYGNGLTLTQSYNAEGLLSEQTLGNLWKQTYSYDGNGQVTTIAENDLTTQYTFDSLLRLTQEAGSQTREYQYDAVGNRLLTLLNQRTNQRFSYVANSNLQNSINKKPVTLNVLGQPDQVNNKSLIWRADGALLQVLQTTPAKQLTTTYGYNALNQRSSKVFSSTTLANGKTVTTVSRYSYSPSGQLLYWAWQRSDGQYGAQSYIWLGNQPVAFLKEQKRTHRWSYIHNDQINTPHLATDSNQTIIWRWDHDAFGRGNADTNPDDDSTTMDVVLRFPGQIHDPESGLFYNWHRYYNPNTGRYISSDPIGLAGGENTYAYVGNDPLGYIDPYGLWAWGDPLPQGSVDFSAGMGDAITFGGTSKIRDFMGTNGAVNQCSGAYTSGVVTGIVVQSIIFSGENSAFTREAAISTGRTEAQTLEEQLAMQEVKSNPSGYTPDRMPAMSDTKNGLLAKDGWVKRTQNVNDVEVHYVENTRTGQTTDFKFKD